MKDSDFVFLLAKRFIQVLVPQLFRELNICPAEADRCELEGTAYTAANAANAAAYTAVDAAYTANAAAHAAYAAANAANAANNSDDKYLKLAASLALEVLITLKSPGVVLLSL